MAMPVKRFFAYVQHIPALQAEEQASLIEAASMPYMDKRDRQRVMERIQQLLGRKQPQRSRGKRMVGDIPEDVYRLMALQKESPLFRNLVTFVDKKPEAAQDE
jgi:hypothetical protein